MRRNRPTAPPLRCARGCASVRPVPCHRAGREPPETETSERARLSKPGVTEPGQLITCAPATDEFLAEIFQ